MSMFGYGPILCLARFPVRMLSLVDKCSTWRLARGVVSLTFLARREDRNAKKILG